jgi:hypothetical protein
VGVQGDVYQLFTEFKKTYDSNMRDILSGHLNVLVVRIFSLVFKRYGYIHNHHHHSY